MIGRTLAHYRIEEKLGEGGMGVVYRAFDTHLDRQVAIKVLRADAVSNPERRLRFVQEAKAASALNHPNIVTIHDVHTADGTDFIAMEYVAGKTLDQLVGHSGLPIRDALQYATQIADALAIAHQAGIVHRDLKPGNIMVTDKGGVKLLDFGLAKLTEQTETGPGAPTATVRPHTEEGAIIGTVAYMSPEQAEGKKVDARSDIFSFGSVLYEMLTGRRAFQGETRVSTLAAILREEPKPVSEIAAGTPRELERLVARCMRKDPERRLRHMDDVRTCLQDLKEESDSGQLGTPAPLARRRRMAPLAALAILLIASAAGAAWWISARRSVATPTTGGPVLRRLTSDAGLTIDPTLSPDGKLVAYASDRGASSGSETGLDIWVQQVATGERLRLTSDAADEREPAFSPDGSRIAYRSEQDGGGIYVVPVLGGEPRRIVRDGRSPRFSPNGERLAYWIGGMVFNSLVQGKAYVVPVSGGQSRQIQPQFHSAVHPMWSPDGERLIFVGARDSFELVAWAKVMDWWITPVEGDRNAAVRTGAIPFLAKRPLGTGPDGFIVDRLRPAAWLPGASGASRLLLSARSGDAMNIWSLPISDRNWQVAGEPERLTFGAGSERLPYAVQLPGGRERLVFSNLSENFDIWAIPLDANRGVAKGVPQRLTQEEGPEIRPSISTDGKVVVFQRADAVPSVWRKDLASGKESIVARPATQPKVSSDGRTLAYVFDNKTHRLSLAAGDPDVVCEDCSFPTGWSSDGTKLLDERIGRPTLGLVTPGNRKRISLIEHPSHPLSAGRFSPDDRWISFHSLTTPTSRRIFVAPFRDPTQPGAARVEEKDWIPITDGNGMDRYAYWSPDGNLLYFLSERDGFRCLRAQRLDPATKRPTGPAVDVYHFHHARRSLFNAGDPVNVNPVIAVDKAVFTLLETTGNIWMTEFGTAAK